MRRRDRCGRESRRRDPSRPLPARLGAARAGRGCRARAGRRGVRRPRLCCPTARSSPAGGPATCSARTQPPARRRRSPERGSARSLCVHGDSPGRRAARGAGSPTSWPPRGSTLAPVRVTELVLRPAGDRAVLIEVPDTAAAAQGRRAAALRVPGLVDVVPGALHGARDLGRRQPARAGRDRCARARRRPRREPSRRRSRSRSSTTAPTSPRSPSSLGLVVERSWPGTRARLHGRVHRLRAGLRLPDRRRPATARAAPRRCRAPAYRPAAWRSQAPYSGIYPREAPGGWQLIGRTASALRPGPRRRRRPRARRPRAVRRRHERDRGHRARPADDGAGPAAAPGWAHVGVPPSGAVDPRALERGNRLVGNDRGAAALEATLIGPKLRFHQRGARRRHGRDGRRPFAGRRG